jgi:hypothetical protein
LFDEEKKRRSVSRYRWTFPFFTKEAKVTSKTKLAS